VKRWLLVFAAMLFGGALYAAPVKVTLVRWPYT
jgi:hypothetical protein